MFGEQHPSRPKQKISTPQRASDIGALNHPDAEVERVLARDLGELLERVVVRPRGLLGGGGEPVATLGAVRDLNRGLELVKWKRVGERDGTHTHIATEPLAVLLAAAADGEFEVAGVGAQEGFGEYDDLGAVLARSERQRAELVEALVEVVCDGRGLDGCDADHRGWEVV